MLHYAKMGEKREVTNFEKLVTYFCSIGKEIIDVDVQVDLIIFCTKFFTTFIIQTLLPNRHTVFDPISAHTPISAQSSNFIVFRLQVLYNSICCRYSAELTSRGIS